MPGFIRAAHSFLIVLPLLGGCAEFGWNPLDPKEWEDPAIPVPAVSVVWRTPPLDGRESVRRSLRQDDGDYVVEYRWPRTRGTQAHAGLRLEGKVSATVRQARLADPGNGAADWPELAMRSLAEPGKVFLQADPLAGGDWLWQRALVGPELCVLFARVPASEPDGLHSGYFCQPAGDPLSDGQAAGVVGDLVIAPQG